MERHTHGFRSGISLLGLVILAALLAGWARLPSRQGTQAAPAATLTPANDPADMHTVTVTFNYDFGANPSCQEKPALKTCIKQFIVYDISVQRSRLFSMPVPQGAHGLVKGISGQSPSRIYLPGRHLIAVTAQSAAGSESAAAQIIIDVTPKVPGSAAPPSK